MDTESAVDLMVIGVNCIIAVVTSALTTLFLIWNERRIEEKKRRRQ